MNIKSTVITSLTVCGALALTGCTGGSPNGTPETSAVSASSDETACIAFGDVLTIIENADAGVRDGRMEAQEQEGWYRLATRVLDRVPTSGEGAVRDAIVELREAAPVIAQGAVQATGIQSDEWAAARMQLGDACAASGVDLALEMFTGG